ncbi:permease [Vibrio taketomensis]|uniref:permease n=1 Tax=Vibrio taketomensis TaxID=2572923 RepID=UPI001389904A|nr:permease [Vibrio taketomensis]
MLEVFTHLADFITFGMLNMQPESKWANSLHFFIEDTTKIFALLLILIYVIALLRAGLNPERVRDYLQGKNRFLGYFLGSVFGAITPFCSCSSIPLFLGFVSARIPLGVTISFLLTSPLINEIALVMLGSMLGLKFTIMYVVVGMALGILGGLVIDWFKAERWLIPELASMYQQSTEPSTITHQPLKLSLKQRHDFAQDEAVTIFKRIWKWVIVGVGIGALIHGMVPADWFAQHLGQGQWWSVPAATLVGIPMYTNATAIIPIMSSLLAKGLPLGTTLAFCMSSVAVSIPEFTMLKQVMTFKLLGLIFVYLLISMSVIGWFFNMFNLIGM